MRWEECPRESKSDGQYTIQPPRLEERFGPARRRGGPLEPRHFDIAHSLQGVLEETVVELAHWLHRATGCDDLIAATVQKPGGTASTAVVTLREVGSIATGTFHVFASSACASTNAGAETYHGTGDLCAAVALTIHDDTNNRCYYPTQAAGACTLTAASTLATFSTAYPNDTTPLVLSTTSLSSGIAFTIQAQLNSTATNTVQGRTASISFGWKIAQ